MPPMSSDQNTTVYRGQPVAAAQTETTGFTPGYVFANNFRLERQIGRGGMGEAWKAFDLNAERYVVIKLLPKEIQHVKEAIENVRASFKKVHGLQHAHICPVYGIFTDPVHGLYLVMKYIDGVSLDVYRKRIIEKFGSFKFSEAVQILWGIAQGLDYAHEKKIVHRDIKPQNIMISKEDGVQIIDFGLAEEIRTSLAHFSQVQMEVSGTRHYMSPEQWRGKYQDAKTDQYAMAVMAYELFSGKFPFHSSDVTVLRMTVLNDEAEPLAGIPDHVNDALLKALSKRREDRFDTCRAFVRAMATKPKIQDKTEVSEIAGNIALDNALNENASQQWRPPVIDTTMTTPNPLVSIQAGGDVRQTTANKSADGYKKSTISKNIWIMGLSVIGATAILLGGMALLPKKITPPNPDIVAETKTTKEVASDVASATENTLLPVLAAKSPVRSQDLSQLTDDEKRYLQQQYPELDWKATNYKFVVLKEFTRDALQSAFDRAAETPESDFIVVRTTPERRTIAVTSPIMVAFDSGKKGKVVLASLGKEKLVLDGNKKSQIVCVNNSDIVYETKPTGNIAEKAADEWTEIGFAGISFINGYSSTDGEIGNPGGAMQCVQAVATILDCDFTGNTSRFASSQFKGHPHYTASGGGLWASDCKVVLRDVSFVGNTADRWGGGFFLGSTETTATNIVARENSAERGGGFNLFPWNGAAFRLTNGTILDNKSKGDGGGISVELNWGGPNASRDNVLRFANLIVAGNTSGGSGGGMKFSGFRRKKIELDHVTVFRNASPNLIGGIDIVSSAQTELNVEYLFTNCIFAENKGKTRDNVWMDSSRGTHKNIKIVASDNLNVGDAETFELHFKKDRNNRTVKPEALLGIAKQQGKMDVVAYLEGVKTGAGDSVAAKTPSSETKVTGSPTFTAAEQAEIDKFLAEHGKDVKAKDDKGNTSLHKAAKTGSLAVVKYLVSQGADVHAKNDDGKTTLHEAVVGGRFENVKYLVSQGADIHAKNNWDMTPLNDAVQMAGHLEIVKFLVSQGADVNTRNCVGYSPLDHAKARRHTEIVKFLENVRTGDANPSPSGDKVLGPLTYTNPEKAAIVQFIKEHGKDIKAKALDGKGRTPLHTAAENGKNAVVKYLLSEGADIRAKNNAGHTSLHDAASNGHLEVVKFLVSQGADTKAKTNEGKVPLDLAKEKEHAEIVKYLESIEAGTAGPSPGAKKAALPTFTAAEQAEIDKFVAQHGKDVKAVDKENNTLLHKAAMQGKVAVAKYLVSQGANVNAKGHLERFPLHHAAIGGHLEFAKYLIDQGAGVDAKKEFGTTPLWYASGAGHGNIELVKFLVSQGANVNAQGYLGKYPLHRAAEGGHLDIAKYLVSRGADTKTKTHKGETPLDLAKEKGHMEIVKYLESVKGGTTSSPPGGSKVTSSPPAQNPSVVSLAYRQAISKHPSLIRYHAFDGGPVSPNLAPSKDVPNSDLVYKTQQPLEAVEGPFKDVKAVRLDAGWFEGPKFGISKAFSIEMRVRLLGEGSAGSQWKYGTLCCLGDGHANGFRLVTQYVRQILAFDFGGPNHISTESDRPIPFGVWTHIAITWDGKTIRMYVDGTLYGSAAYDKAFVPSNEFRVGFNKDAGLRSVKMDVAEVAVYKNALPPEEILAHAQMQPEFTGTGAASPPPSNKPSTDNAATEAGTENFQIIFDGQSLSGWDGDKNVWSVDRKEKVLVNTAKGNLYSTREYDDFIAEFEFRVEEKANNGFLFRVDEHGNGMEIQVADDRNYDSNYNGCLYQIIQGKKASIKMGAGQRGWNTMRIVADGTRITTYVNGEKVVDGDIGNSNRAETKVEKGRIGFMGFGGKTEFRNIKIRSGKNGQTSPTVTAAKTPPSGDKVLPSAPPAPRLAVVPRSYRQAISKHPSLIRYHAFNGGPVSPNLAPSKDVPNSDFVYKGSQPFGMVDGPYKDVKAVRLDAGWFEGPKLGVSRAFCVEMRVRLLGAGTEKGYNHGTIFSLGGGYDDGFRLKTELSRREFVFSFGGSDQTRLRTEIRRRVPYDAWAHIATSWDGKTMRIYVDGTHYMSFAHAHAIAPPHSGFRIGFIKNGIGSVKMDVAEVGVYNTALPPEEILAHSLLQPKFTGTQATLYRAAIGAVERRDFKEASKSVDELLTLKLSTEYLDFLQKFKSDLAARSGK